MQPSEICGKHIEASDHLQTFDGCPWVRLSCVLQPANRNVYPDKPIQAIRFGPKLEGNIAWIVVQRRLASTKP